MNVKRRERVSKLNTGDQSQSRPFLGSKLAKLGVISENSYMNLRNMQQRSMTSFSNQRLQIINELNDKQLQKSTVQSLISRENHSTERHLVGDVCVSKSTTEALTKRAVTMNNFNA